jgi:hypothetical protein
MKQARILWVASMVIVFLSYTGVMAGDMTPPAGHEKTMQQGAPGMGAMGHSDRAGENIRNATVDGYQLAYHLIDMREKMKAMKSEGHTHKMSTHHLMVYVTDPAGSPVGSAKTGFLVTAPNVSDQKVMGVAMGVGGYGADIDFSAPGDYALTSKLIMGDKTIKDNFTYAAK